MVFVYTSRGYLRSWSVSGIQQSVLTPCGHVVTMVGGEKTLCVVYEDSYPLQRMSSFSMMMIVYDDDDSL